MKSFICYIVSFIFATLTYICAGLTLEFINPNGTTADLAVSLAFVCLIMIFYNDSEISDLHKNKNDL